jgi:hypothetical protein
MEVSEYGRMNFDFILLDLIQCIGKQLQKLPNEQTDLNLREAVGVKRKDIILSYCDSVEHMEQLLKPYRTHEYIISVAKLVRPKKNDETTEIFEYAKIKFGCLIDLCNQKQFLFGKAAQKISVEEELLEDEHIAEVPEETNGEQQ